MTTVAMMNFGNKLLKIREVSCVGVRPFALINNNQQSAKRKYIR